MPHDHAIQCFNHLTTAERIALESLEKIHNEKVDPALAAIELYKTIINLTAEMDWTDEQRFLILTEEYVNGMKKVLRMPEGLSFREMAEH